MIKFVCIAKSDNYPELEIGKVYESDGETDLGLHDDFQNETFIINISDYKLGKKLYVYPRRFFQSIDGYRNTKINKILR